MVELGPGVQNVRVGDRIHGAWGHRTHQVFDEAYAAHLGSIALNGVHDAGINVGDTVAVFGLGALDQIVAQLARRSGARVIVEERNVHRAEMRDFLRAIRGGGPTRTPLREGALSLDMALAAARSAVERREVRLI